MAVCARLAKMSRIRLDRSRILICSSFSILATCFDERSSSKIAIPISFFSTNSLISASFPWPTNVRGLGFSTFWVKRATTCAPAVSARNSSSSRYSFTFCSLCCWVMRPTSTARSVVSLLITNSFIQFLGWRSITVRRMSSRRLADFSTTSRRKLSSSTTAPTAGICPVLQRM